MTLFESRGMPAPASFANRPHGTRLRYRSGCRCVPCRAANSRCETEWLARRKRGEGGQIVSAQRARAHILRLSRLGVGRIAVAEASDVGKTTIFLIRRGTKTRIRASTERAILAVTRQALKDHALVSARMTWVRIGRLLQEGFSKAEIARRLRKKSPALQLRKHTITALNASRVERLYRYITEVPTLSQKGGRS